MTGRLIAAPTFYFLVESEFSEGVLAACVKQNECGYLDTEAKWAVHPTFWRTGRFSEGLARVMPNANEVAYINHDGSRAFNTPLRYGWDFHDGRAAASVDGEHWGMIDHDGRFVLQPTFQFIGLNHDQRALFTRNKRWGVIDYSGKVTVNASFDEADLLKGGVVRVELANERGYFDRDGRAIEPIGLIKDYGKTERLTLFSVSGHRACGAFRLDLDKTGFAKLSAECETPKRAVEKLDALSQSGRYESTQASRVFAALAEYVADAGLLEYDASKTSYGVDIPYDRIEIETASGVRSLDIAYAISPKLRMLDWSLKQAAREIEWKRSENANP